jgi:transcriptional regulator with XRE-family HTH domain
MKNVDTVIRSARMARGWSQSHLAEAAGLSKRTVMRAEGGAKVAGESLMAMGAALGVDLFHADPTAAGRSLIVHLPDVVTPTWLRWLIAPRGYDNWVPVKLVAVFAIICLGINNPYFYRSLIDPELVDFWFQGWALVVFLFACLVGCWLVGEMLDEWLAKQDPTRPIRIDAFWSSKSRKVE